MEGFPCPLERTVASALLLLATTPPSLSPPNSKSKSNESEKSLELLSNFKSCSSSLTSDNGSSAAAPAPAHPLRIVAVVARCHEMKLKVVRKSRSKNSRSSGHRKIDFSRKMAATDEVSSCVSSSSSAVSSGKEVLVPDLKTKPLISSASMRHRAEEIMRLLSNDCASEVRIRQLLGDSPDTSKALRMLLKQEEIKRMGAGGRRDPYIYTIVSMKQEEARPG
ncbi:hypothetical protein LOK49_LG12G02795 [Camellia lanceoleosa]|uniref:Uncharacterized protein n=1 Tax=Camellia lanceoleosa TaxID=1840588 RepID=A0ACC0FQ24_9ERIC|nr:hypothetical protein LOK49_LG12G02795 [Camellia lanceoleosa]